IEGAHTGVGLGTQFLRHIERTRLFVHVIDVSGFTGRDPLSDYEIIVNELCQHDELNKSKEDYISLSSRPQIVVFNKTDAIDESILGEILNEFEAKGIRVIPISAVTGKNIDVLINEM